MTRVPSVSGSDTSTVLLFRIAAGCAVVGALAVSFVLALLGDVPRGDPVAVLEHVNDRPWMWMRLSGILGMLAWVVAFAALARAVSGERARVIADLARPLLAVAVAVFAVDYAVDGLSVGQVAIDWADGSVSSEVLVERAQVLELVAGATSILSQALLGLALLVHAVAYLFTDDFPKVVTWFGVVGCAGWFVGGGLLFAGVPGVSFELFLPFSMLTMLWVLAVGVLAWRRGTRVARAGPALS